WAEGADALTADDEGWWTLEKRLPPGEHRYQYRVDDVVICDPYALEVADPRDGVDAPTAVGRPGAAAYAWRHDGWSRPAFADLALDELQVGDFTAEGTLAAAAQRLDYLRDLGINAIQLMPLTETALHQGWGYQPTYYFAVKSAYGSADDLRRFV